MAPSLPFFSRSSLSRKEGGVISAAHHSAMRKRGRVLPREYTPVEYLQSSGTQYVDTGVVPSAGMEIGVKVQRTSNGSDWDGIVGSFNGDVEATGVAIRYNGTAGNKIAPTYGGRPSPAPSITAGAVVELLLSEGEFAVDGVTTNTWTPDLSSLSAYPIFCFNVDLTGAPFNGRFLRGRIYYLWMKRNGKLVFDAIPVRNGSTGYLYDFVSKSALGNAGSGSFTYGSDIDFNG